MSVRVMSWVWSYSTADAVDRLVLLAIADCANDEGADAYPSMATLAAKTRLHERSVQRSIHRLIDAGELVVKKNAGPKGANRYRVTMNPGAVPPPADSHPGAVPDGATPPRQKVTPAHSRSTPGTVPPSPRQAATPTPGTPPPEPSLNHPLTVREPSGAQAIVAEWIERCAKRPPERIVGQLSAQIRALLAEGIDPDDVRRGVAAWMGKDLAPSLLPSLVNSVMNQRASPKRSTTNDRVAAGLALAKELERREIGS